MFLVKGSKKTGGSRFKHRLYKPLVVKSSLAFFIKKNTNFHNRYQKTLYSKAAHMPLLQFNIRVPKWYFFCIDILGLNTRYGAVYKSSNGSYFLAPLVEAIKLGSKVSWLRGTFKKFFFFTVGTVARLRFLKLATLVSNIGYDRPKFATARGTYSKIRLIKPRAVTIVLPSGTWAILKPSVSGIIGRNAGARSYKEVLGKASERKYNLKRIIVRSCAKNPVDHPNGGRTRGKTLFKTPWGKPAKRNK